MGQFLVILRGTPASGKSTIAKRLRDFSKKVVWLKVDNFKDFFAEDSSLALDYVHGAAIATLHYLLGEGFSIVMDGVFQDTKAIDEALTIAKEKNVTVVVYQLQCSLEVLQQRDKERPGVPEGIRKPLDDQLLATIDKTLAENGYSYAKTLDTEHQTSEQCTKQINDDLINQKV